MANLRVIYNNIADRNLGISGTNGVSTLPISNILTDIKTEVFRCTTTQTQITVTWTDLESLQSVQLPFCNLSDTATIRVRCYTLAADTTANYDSGTVLACPGSVGYDDDWRTLPVGSNTYPFGGGVYAGIWFPALKTARKIIINIVDTTNPSGYVEFGRLVVGQYWSPAYNPDYNSVTLGVGEDSKHERSEAGDLYTDRGAMYKTLGFNLVYLPAADRDVMWRILRGNGMYRPVFVSLSPEVADANEEQVFQLYGKLSKNSAIQYQFLNQFATSLQIEEI